MKRAFAAALLAFAACAHSPSHAASAVDGGADLVAEAQAMAEQVARARSLSLAHAVDVEVQPLDAFHQSFEEKTDREVAMSHFDERGLAASWVAFGFVAPEGSAPDAGVALDQLGGVGKRVLDEQIAGFYDELDHTLHLPAVMPAGAQAKDPKSARAIREFMVAHELDHALQDQHFGFKRLLELPRASDAQLAMNSIYEGDAMLAAMVFTARAAHADEKAMLRFADRMFASGGMLTGGKELESAPPIVRDRLVFPYQAGMHLCIAIYRTGGWELVDALFAHPPQTTEQVLHPEKYLAGDPEVPVRAPEPPAGMKAIAHGTLGELGAQILVEGSAEGWGGDAYTVAADGKKLVLLWSTVWDTPAAAQRFMAELQRIAPSWHDGPPPASAPGWTITRDASFTLRGNQVVMVRGLPHAAAAPLLEPLFALAEPTPKPAPPLATTKLAPEEQLGAVLPDGAYGSEPLGLYVPTPQGFRAIAEPPGMPLAALVVVRGQPYADATFSVLAVPYTDAEANGWFDAALEKEHSRELRRAAISIGQAHGRESVRDHGDQKIRTVAIPACGGRKTWVFRIRWKGERPAELDDWLEAFAPRDDAPACHQP